MESSESENDSEDVVKVDDEDEEDSEQITVTSLFDDAKFDSVTAMLAYVKSSFNFDLVSVQQRLGERFYFISICFVRARVLLTKWL